MEDICTYPHRRFDHGARPGRKVGGIHRGMMTIARGLTSTSGPSARRRVRVQARVWCHLTGSQTDHAFAETGGHRRTREETKAGQTEYRRTPKETGGHQRTRHTAGSGP
jgi:hypothetical protein